MKLRLTLLLAAVTFAATAKAQEGPVANDAPAADLDAPERAKDSLPWPTFHRALNGEVAPRVLQEGPVANDAPAADLDAPERAKDSLPWPTFHRALNGEVAPRRNLRSA